MLYYPLMTVCMHHSCFPDLFIYYCVYFFNLKCVIYGKPPKISIKEAMILKPLIFKNTFTKEFFFFSYIFKQERVDKGIETEGSNLSGVSAKCAWDDLSRPPEDEEDSRSICIGTQPRRLSGKGLDLFTA